MRSRLLQSLFLALLGAVAGSAASAEVRKVPYPRIAVELVEPYKPDPAFETMRKAFAEAVARKDAEALFSLAAPGFVWTVSGALAGDYDTSRAPLHSFKVLFGFRQPGKDADGPVEDGPFWSALAAFAQEETFYQTEGNAGLVCSPISATVADEDLFEQARGKIETEEGAEWYFVMRDTPVARAPNDKGPPVGRISQEAVPVIQPHPAAPDDQPPPTPTHFEVLLPSGRSGWIPAAAAVPLETGRLCYVAAPGGIWKIAIYDAIE